MTTPADLLSLAERVEKEGASRELADAVCAALGIRTGGIGQDDDGWFRWVRDHDCPNPLTSLDAVKTLEGDRSIEVFNNEHGTFAIVDMPVEQFRGTTTGDHAEPRARLAAVLRALAAEKV